MHRTKGNAAITNQEHKKDGSGNEIDAPAETNDRLIQPACYQIAQACLYIGCSLTNGVDEYI